MKVNIAIKRPDIAKLMINYNTKHNIKEENNPENIGYGSITIICICCENGHEIKDQANRLHHLKTDRHGNYYCRECEKLGLIKVEKENIKRLSVQDFCNKNIEYQYILNEWNFAKNAANGHTPQSITTGSEKPLVWLCNKGHEFEMSVFDRIRRKRGCPYCNGSRLSKGINDLASQNPEILKDWDYNKNDVLPDEVFQHAKRKVWWKCHKCNHEWEATICRRTTNIQTGCPKCHSNATSIPEMSIYITLKDIFQNVEHRKIINGLEYDIFIHDLNLAIEYDGIRFHGENRKERDRIKSENAKQNSFSFIRIKETNDETLHNSFLDDTLYISNKNRNNVKNTCETLLQNINNQFSTNISETVNENIVLLARNEIRLKEHENSILIKSPKDADEWCYELNGKILPEHIAAGNDSIKFWWKCKKCGNVYQKSAYEKTHTFKEGGCVKCTPSFKTSVICIETNKFYMSIADATRDTGTHHSSICDVCTGKQKTAGKLHWRYATEQEIAEQKVIST